MPPFADFFVPVLRALDALGGSASIEEIDDKTAVLTECVGRGSCRPCRRRTPS